jgi:hypothetical protein
MALDRRHPLCGIAREDACHQRARLRIARHDGAITAAELARRHFEDVETQPSFAQLLVGAVASEAMRGQQRLNVAAELNRLRADTIGTGERKNGYTEEGPAVHDGT